MDLQKKMFFGCISHFLTVIEEMAGNPSLSSQNDSLCLWLLCLVLLKIKTVQWECPLWAGHSSLISRTAPRVSEPRECVGEAEGEGGAAQWGYLLHGCSIYPLSHGMGTGSVPCSLLFHAKGSDNQRSQHQSTAPEPLALWVFKMPELALCLRSGCLPSPSCSFLLFHCWSRELDEQLKTSAPKMSVWPREWSHFHLPCVRHSRWICRHKCSAKQLSDH